MVDNMVQCPKCGYDNDGSATECDKCGVTLSLVLKKSLKNGKKMPKSPPAKAPKTEPQDLTTCPKCGHDVLQSSEECIKCGIIFSKFFKVQDRRQKEAQEKAEAEEKRIEQEKKEAEEKKKADALRKKEEKKEREAKKQADARKKAQEKKEKEEKEKAEAIRKAEQEKEKEASEKAKALKIEQEEKEKKAREEAEAAAKEEKTIKQLENEIQILQSDAASLKMETEALKKAEQESLRKNEDAQNQIDALNSETETLRQETLSLKEKKDALEEAEAKRIDAEEAEKKAEKEKADALKTEREDIQKRTETILKTLVPKPNFEELLKKYEGEEIGINYDDPAEIKNARLAKVNADHFSVLVMENELLYSYPFGNILSIVESADGVPVDTSGEAANYPIVVRVLHLMVKKKWSFM